MTTPWHQPKARKAILFDLDDTISDHQHSRRVALAALVEEYPDVSIKDVRQLEVIHERHLQATFNDRLAGRITLAEARSGRIRRLLADVGLTLTANELIRAASVYRSAYDGCRRAVPGVIPLIRILKETMKIAVVTNGLVVRQLEKIKLCGLEGQFDATVISERVGVKKPARKMFDVALSELGVKADEAIVIGDSWKLDVLGARNAGIAAVWFNRYEEQCPDPGCAVEITSLEPTDDIVRLLTASGRD